MASRELAFRRITPDELAVVHRIVDLTAPSPFSRELLDEMKEMDVAENCTCGCASLTFATDRRSAQYAVLEMAGKTKEGWDVGLLLFGDQSHLTSLEVFGYTDWYQGGLPTVESIRVVNRRPV